MEIVPGKNINTRSISKEKFDRLPEHPDNYLFFVYSDLGRDEHGEPKLSVSLYKGDIPVLSSGTSGGFGKPGKPGKDGNDGENAVLARVSASIGANPSSPAKVTNSGSIRSAALNFVLPRGPQGEKGSLGGETLPDTSAVDLSPLKGAQGKEGEPGNKGADGLIGPKGEDSKAVVNVEYYNSELGGGRLAFPKGNIPKKYFKRFLLNRPIKDPIKFETGVTGYFSENATQMKDGTFNEDNTKAVIIEGVCVNNKGEFEIIDDEIINESPSVYLITPFEKIVKVPYETSYGVYHEDSVSESECTRIGNMDLHKTLPIHSKMRGCLLDDDGNVVKYLDPDDWTGEVRDGSQGQVMVEIPEHYRKFSYENGRLEVRLSENKLKGYHKVPKMYVSAYEAALDRTNLKLASVVNNTAQYRGGANQADWDGLSKSQLGRPATNISLTYLRTYARKRKEGSTQWNCYTYEAHKALYWLFVVEYATLNSQAAYNSEKTAEGYMQGGLGSGVTDLDGEKWNNFNSYYPFIPCGHTDSLGNKTGVVAYEMPTEYDAAGLTTYVPRYRGVENPFGHIFKLPDGILPISSYDVYTCKNPALFASYLNDGYTNIGHIGYTSGNIKNIIGGEEGDIIGSVTNRYNKTPFSDHYYPGFSGVGYFCCLFGGRADYGAHAGFLCLSLNAVPSGTYKYTGSRLCFIP